MSMILSWALFPLVLAAVGLGWGALVGWAGSDRELGALAIPTGLGAAIAVAGILTAFDGSAPAAAPVVAAGALAGLVRAFRRTRIPVPALIGAVGVLLVYGAPVILSGEATFLGYVRLDDTATWLGLTDQLFAHGRNLSSLDPGSTYALVLSEYVTGAGYPSGAFMLPGVGHWITGIDAAWIFQPDMAVCAAALAFCCFDLLESVIASAWLRAFAAFIAAQSALLFGYAAWGGIKEVTAAFLLALGIATIVRMLGRARPSPGDCLPVAIAAAALTVTLGAAAAIYVAPALLFGMTVLLWRGTRNALAVVIWDLIASLNAVLAALAFHVVHTDVVAFATPDHSKAAGIILLALDFGVLGWLPGVARAGDVARRFLGLGVLTLGCVLIVLLDAGATPYVTIAGLVALVAIAATPVRPAIGFLAGAGAPLLTLPALLALALPAWLTLGSYLPAGNGFTNSAASSGTVYGNLTSALRGIQIAGIWLDGDFRSFPNPPTSSVVNHLLIWFVLAGAAFALAWTLWRRSFALALYVGVALGSLALLSLDGAVAWVTGKSLAFSSPAILLAGVTGAAILFSRERMVAAMAGVVVLGAIAGGVLWSNYLQFHNVTLAPGARLADLQKIGGMVAGKGPTFLNEYEIYGDRHFLRAGAPVEPAERRPVNLPTLGNAFLTDPAWADLDSFALATLAPYRSLVVREAPTASQPSSLYGEHPVWQGRYYQLWQQPAHPSHRVISHSLLGDNVSDAFCGAASNAPGSGVCPIAPAAVPVCKTVHALAATATADHGELLAYERTNPLVVRGNDLTFDPSDWYVNGPNVGPVVGSHGVTATWSVKLAHPVRNWQVWLGGTFSRGFDVTVDGRRIGSASGDLNPVGAYDRVGAPLALGAGTHTIAVVYRSESPLSPGSADTEVPTYDEVSAVVLAPPSASARYVTVAPAKAAQLCGRTLDWIEIIAPR